MEERENWKQVPLLDAGILNTIFFFCEWKCIKNMFCAKRFGA